MRPLLSRGIGTLLGSVVAAIALAGCASATDDVGGDDRGPLGKADAIGSCLTDDGESLCGGPSEGNCWCDDQCVDFGDCCDDRVAVCEALGLDVARIDSAAQFDAMAFSGQEGVIIGKSVKFVIDHRDPENPSIHWLNANFDGAVSDEDAKKFHFFFAREVLGVTESTQEFNDVTYWTNEKRYFAGTLQLYELGEGQAPVYAIQFYPQDVIAEGTALVAARAVASTVNIADARLAFVAMGQQQTIETVRDDMAGIGVESLTLDEILGSLDYIPMQVGEAWGFLRIFPQDHDTLSAVDIPVFDELPLDLTVVAGTITRAVQDASSHINLKSKERGTPNMVLRSSGHEHELLSQFADQPVHLVVSADGFTVEATTEEIVREKLAEKLDKPWQILGIDPDAVITSYDEMCPGSADGCVGRADEFGGKAGGLGFLRHRDVLGTPGDAGSLAAELGYEVAPAGVAIPVQMYVEFVNNNPVLEAAIASFVEQEKAMELSVAERVAKLDEIREMFMNAEFPVGMAEEIEAAAIAALPPETGNLKIRSSANAEDIPGFDGAGLYESFRVKLSAQPAPCRRFFDEEDQEMKVRPRTTACVVKGVYASLWNKRAVEERSFARVDHETAGMGLAIVRRYKEKDDIAANSVVITRVLNSSGVFGYSFSNQKGNNVVTNPAAGTNSESVIAAFLPNVDTTFSVTRFAKPSPETPPLTQTVMTNDQMATMLEISQTVEEAYCRANPAYYPGNCNQVLFDPDKPTSVDMEFKLYENGDFLCKQVREFAGS